jgi:DNA (cytosine-5)-methyltransferase 1
VGVNYDMRHLDTFAGIAGFSLAVDMVWPDAEHIFCEIDPFCQAVICKHYPQSTIYGDIKTLDGKAIGPVDILTGGFPCQPFSTAGLRKGTEDDRHLWPQMLRVIREVRPRWVIGENVGGILTWNRGMVFEQVHLDLESAGYEVQSFVLPAAGVDAPHRRERVWFIANRTSERGQQVSVQSAGIRQQRTDADTPGSNIDASHADPHVVRKQSKPHANTWQDDWHEVASRLCGVDDGVPNRVDRIKSLGNAIVPQVAAEIMRAIKHADEHTV